MVYANMWFEHAIVHVDDSDVAERLWHIIHSKNVQILYGAWYRPPMQGEIASIDNFDAEVSKFGSEVLGAILICDMNAHEAGWLCYSDGTSIEGCLLRDVCEMSLAVMAGKNGCGIQLAGNICSTWF